LDRVEPLGDARSPVEKDRGLLGQGLDLLCELPPEAVRQVLARLFDVHARSRFGCSASYAADFTACFTLPTAWRPLPFISSKRSPVALPFNSSALPFSLSFMRISRLQLGLTGGRESF